MIRIISIIAICFFYLTTYSQQENMYTQFMFNKMGINPAYAGRNDYIDLNMIYRDQWSGFEGAPKALQVSANFPVVYENIGLGAKINRQTIGITDKISISGLYSYKLQLGSGTMNIGLETTARRYSLDFTDDRLLATEGLANDPSIPTSEQTKGVFNVGLGFYYYTEDYYFGVSATNLMNADLDFDSNQDFSQEVLQLNAMMGRSFTVNDDLSITPQFMLRYVENGPVNFDLNVMSTFYEKFMGGITYRSGGTDGDIGESIDLVVGMHITEQLMMGIAYDIGLSKLRDYNNGSFEVTIGYSLWDPNRNVKMVNPRYF